VQARVAQEHGEQVSNSLQALLSDLWVLKQENKQLYADLCAAAVHAAHAADSADLRSGEVLFAEGMGPSVGGLVSHQATKIKAGMLVAAVARADARGISVEANRGASGEGAVGVAFDANTAVRKSAALTITRDEEMQEQVKGQQRLEAEVLSLRTQAAELQAAHAEVVRQLSNSQRMLSLQVCTCMFCASRNACVMNTIAPCVCS
jgi:hypothetical protein